MATASINSVLRHQLSWKLNFWILVWFIQQASEKLSGYIDFFFFFSCTSCVALNSLENSLFPTGWNWHLQASRTRHQWWVKRRPLNGAMGVDGVPSDRLWQRVEASVPESVCVIQNQGLRIAKEHVGREMRWHRETTSIILTGQNIPSGEDNTVGLVCRVRTIFVVHINWTFAELLHGRRGQGCGAQVAQREVTHSFTWRCPSCNVEQGTWMIQLLHPRMQARIYFHQHYQSQRIEFSDFCMQKQSDRISAVAYVQSECSDSIHWQTRLSVNIATQIWMK